ncbi:ABC transporter permease [Deltaproteobacteria bacterium]|nr:ABC transporter permease [Deltaproteobacteria bacterium]
MNRNLFHSFYIAFVKDLRRFYRVLPKVYRLRLWLVFLLQFLAALSESLTVFILTFFGLTIGAPEIARSNPIIKVVFNILPPLAALVQDHRMLLVFSASLVVFFIILKNIVAACSLKLNCSYAEGVSAHIGRLALSHFLNESYYWHLSPASKNVITRMMFRSQLSGFLISILAFYSNSICSLVVFGALAVTQPRMTAMVMVIFAGVSLATYISIRRRLDKAGQIAANLAMAENAAMMAAQRGIREIISFQNQEPFLKAIHKYMLERIPPYIFLSLAANISPWLLEVAGFGTILLALLFLIKTGAGMPQIIAAISMLLLTAWRVLPAVSRAMSTTVSIRGQRPQALICLELLEEFQQTALVVPQPDPDFRFQDRLILENAFFRYPTARGDALEGVSLTIRKGESIGLIGPSGAGKSTLALVLSGLVPLRSGRMLVDGEELSPAGRAAFCRKVGFVPQQPFLLEGTVADNVAFSQWSRDYDLAAVEQACRRAALDFIFKAPLGLQTPLSENGGGLSGGQIQRVAVARALFTQPEVLIMDEATSALDQANENIIKQTIRDLDKSVTAIIIAHRLTTVETCDKIFWLDGGKLRAEGPPAEILPLYTRTFE